MNLEVIKRGLWEILTIVYKDLIVLEATLSGLANYYRAILFKFSAIVEVSRLGVLSDILVYRRQ